MGTWIPFLKRFEEKLLENNPQAEIPLIVAFGGLSGVGKDTLAEGVRDLIWEKLKIKLEIISAGSFIRKLAIEHGYAPGQLHRFTQEIKDDFELAKEVDVFIEENTLEQALKHGGIFIGRMAPFTIGDWGITIYLSAESEIIAKRIHQDPERAEYGQSIEEIIKCNEIRDKADLERLEMIYEITMSEMIQKVDIHLDTSFDSVESNCKFLLQEIQDRILQIKERNIK